MLSFKMLSKEHAVKFLEQNLGICNVEAKAENSKLCLLREYVQRFHRFIPFQNVTAIAKAPDERCVPSFDGILKGYGGMCYSRGVITHLVFKSLGFNSYQVSCSVPTCTESPYTHVSTVVTDIVEEGDAYFVEVGASFPSFEPVPIRALPVQYEHAFLEYKFVQEGNEICRYHRTGHHLGKLPSSIDDEGWQKFYAFEDIPRDDEFLVEYQTPVYTQPSYGAGWFLTVIKISVYPEGKAITLNKNMLKVWDEKTNELELSKELKFEEMESAMQYYFPMLDHTDIRRALDNLKNSGYL